MNAINRADNKNQQQQQQLPTQHQVDSMATGGPASSTTTITTAAITSNNNPPIHQHNHQNNHSNNIGDGHTTNNIAIADAATVAIAKDMLQLHHGASGGGGAAAIILNNNNNNNSNGESPGGVLSPTLGNVTNHPQPPSLLSANAHIVEQQQLPPPPEHSLGYLKFENELLYITEPCTIIGRNSSTSNVHFHVAENNLVSRKHFQLLHDSEARALFVQCLSKNGIFVDDFLQRRNVDPLKLPESCFFRFPSTEIRIQFENFLPATGHLSGSGGIPSGTATTVTTMQQQQQQPHKQPQTSYSTHLVTVSDDRQSSAGNHNQPHHSVPHPIGISFNQGHPQHQQQQQQQQLHGNTSSLSTSVALSQQPPPHHLHQQQQQQLLTVESGTAIYSPLKISIPKKEEKSPYLSPTGTISAANSCPASPRQGFHQNQTNYNNNYGGNNLQNQQDLFQTPSTASYNHNEKPPYSYAQLIVQAISAAPDKQLTLSGIYSFIVKHYPYYRKETNKGWQNSIRHNLSLNRYFIKVARSQDEPGKGSFWRIDPDSGAKLIDHSYKKRRQRSSQGFRNSSYGMPRSAPVSPSHMDNSRESSPLQDIVLQSAPGSPGLSLENRGGDTELVYNSQAGHSTGGNQSNSNNSHGQFNSNSSPYYVTGQQQASHDGGTSVVSSSSSTSSIVMSGNSATAGTLIALKRNHVIASGGQQQGSNAAVVGALHPDIIYEELPADYSAQVEESSDECDGGARVVVTSSAGSVMPSSVAAVAQHSAGSISGSSSNSSNVSAANTSGGGSTAKRPKFISEVL